MKKYLRNKIKSLFIEANVLKGGLADNKSLEDIAVKHGVSIEHLKQQWDIGLEVEKEHTDSNLTADEIVKDHLWENPSYYSDLKKAGIDEEKLNEMPAWKDSSKNISTSIDSNYDAYKKFLADGGFNKLDKFKVNKEYSGEIYERNKDTIYVIILTNYFPEVVGEFIWRKNNKNQWQTESAAVADEHHGKGIATTVYMHMIENYFHTLYSDVTLTGEDGYGSFNIWNRLSQQYNAYIYDGKNYTPVKEFTRDMMGKYDELFVVSVDELTNNIEELNV
jgi:predicted GNAT family acetyltransferase